MTIDTVLYDFGGVLVGWDPYRAYDGHLTRQETEAFFADVDFHALNRSRDAGATWAEARDAVAVTHPHHAASVGLYVDNFDRALTGPIDGSDALVNELKAAGVHLYGLTNWSAELFHHAAVAAPAIALMEDVLVSGRENLAKPDPAIFRLAIERFGLDPARTLFVDDSPANTAVAADMGFHVHTFTGTPALRAALADLGVRPEGAPGGGHTRMDEAAYLRHVERLAHDVVSRAGDWLTLGQEGDLDLDPLHRAVNRLATGLRFVHAPGDGCPGGGHEAPGRE